jgi:Uma2 family endonuclease
MGASARSVMLDGDRLEIPASALTHDGLRRWATSDVFPDGVRVAFVQGEVLLDMSPEELESHNKVKLKIAAVLNQIVEDEKLGEVFADGVLLTHEGASLSTEPDVMFVSWESFDSGRVKLTEKVGRPRRYVELIGSPDLVVEVVSDSSVRKDTELLRAAYLAAGVTEYWMVDARGSEIRFEILHGLGARFSPSAPADQPQISRVLGRRWRLGRSLNRGGRFVYRLEALPLG